MSHVYAGDPYGRDIYAAFPTFPEGLSALREGVANAIRGDGPKRTRNRPHINESPSRHLPPTGNVKGGRVVVPGRPPQQPGPERRAGAAEGDQSVVVPTQSTTGPPSEAEPPKYPARPDPGDAAAEVWALVERAQGGDSAAFGLIYDRYVDTVFRFVYFRVGNRQLA